MVMGMSYEDFWDGPGELPRYYRAAHRQRLEEKNREMWLQGVYFYDALLAVAPALHAFAKNPKPRPYMSEPLPLSQEDAKKQEEAAAKKKMEEIRAKVKAKAAATNKRMQEKAKEGGSEDGS